jgi:hypothetical protein
MIVVTAVICKLAQKYAQMQHPLFGIMPVIKDQITALRRHNA